MKKNYTQLNGKLDTEVTINMAPLIQKLNFHHSNGLWTSTL